jgi:thiol-disulfide isomerase/thioredoxin
MTGKALRSPAAVAPLLLLLCLAVLPGRAFSADDELVALAKAGGKGKVLIADFGLGLCKQCKAQRAILDKIVSAYGGKVVVRMVQVNKEQALTERYGVEMIPMLVFFDGAGKEVYRKSGSVMPYGEIVDRLSGMKVKP